MISPLMQAIQIDTKTAYSSLPVLHVPPGEAGGMIVGLGLSLGTISAVGLVGGSIDAKIAFLRRAMKLIRLKT